MHPPNQIRPTTINMSYYTDSAKLQQEIELAIDKRSGRKFGPPQVGALFSPYPDRYPVWILIVQIESSLDNRSRTPT